jgi:hypothetical protein
MKKSLINVCFALSLGLLSPVVSALPGKFVTKNFTPFESNVKVINFWSTFPTPAGSVNNPTERSVPWIGLKLLCGFTAKQCSADLYMKTDTPNPVFIGRGTLDMTTGEIEPKEMNNNGFIVRVVGPGMIELHVENE